MITLFLLSSVPDIAASIVFAKSICISISSVPYNASLKNFKATFPSPKKTFQFQEDFLDLTVSVGGTNSLADGFRRMFCDIEMMEGKNQYYCEVCRKLVNAKKVNGLLQISSFFKSSFCA